MNAVVPVRPGEIERFARRLPRFEPTTPERIREALAHIDASDRDMWVRAAMSVKSALGDEGFDVWDAWSQTAPNYDPRAAREVWRSIRPDGGVTIATLFHEAKARGWRDTGPPLARVDVVPQRDPEQAAREQAEIDAERQQAREWARAILRASRPAGADHPYLTRKQVQPTATLREIDADQAAALLGYRPQCRGEPLTGRLLVVPIKQGGTSAATLELIDEHGRKTALRGRGTRAGGFWATDRLPAGDEGGFTLLIGEGVATALSAVQATGHLGIAALSCGNLEAVARAMRERYPRADIVLLADLVKNTGEPDRHAIEAARAVGGRVAVPDFGEGRELREKDLNDLAIAKGADAVARAVAEAKAPASSEPPRTAGTVEPLPERGASDWDDPAPLPDDLPPVPAFDAALLPEALRPWVLDIAHRMQCPPDFPAVGALVGLSGLIGARAVVRPKKHDDWRVVPNLWGMVVGRPGVMKSPALGEVLRPLHRLEAEEVERWQAAHDEWEVERRVAELAAKQNEKQAAAQAAKDPARARELLRPVEVSPEPTARRFVINDATVEKLCELLAANPWGVLTYRDELFGLLRDMERQGQEGARAFYLTAYDGSQGYTQDRIGRGTHRVPRVCLAMLGSIQPGRLQSFVREAVSGGAGDDGLLQRFGLLVWPDTHPEFRPVDQWPDSEARRTAWGVFERLSRLQPASDTEPQEWRFSPEAQAIFWEWLTPLETEIRGDSLHPALASHLAKYRKLVPSLALIFALVDDPSSDGVIGQAELLRALAWADYLRAHAERAYSAAVVPETSGAAALLSKLRDRRLCDQQGRPLESFTPRQVAVKHWTGLTTPEAVRRAADLLVDYGWLRRDYSPPGQAGGRPSDRYWVHPLLLSGATP